MHPSSIIDNVQIAPNTYLLSIKRSFEFIPGQVVGVSIYQTLTPRLYSICNGNQESILKILYNIKPQGKLTPQLCQLKKGDTIYITQPSGNFTFLKHPAFWIAAGTGIAPFVSMYLSGLKHTTKIIHGARTLSDFYYSELFSDIPDTEYIRCSSIAKSSGIYTGRLTQYLREIPMLPPDQMYYLCGSPEMVVETRDILILRNIPFENIVSEIYF